ncbi:MAG: DUF2285 domain-containing protein [Thalassobaculum sp.]
MKSPEDDARSAVVFWIPHVCPHVLPVTAVAAGPAYGARAFRLSDVRCRTTVLLSPNGVQHLLFHDSERALQLAVHGSSVFVPVRLMVDIVAEPGHVRHRLVAIEAFNAVLATGAIPASSFPAEPRGRRLRVVLQALDGWLAGATNREIAAALFGRRRVDADWRDPRDHLRDQVRRAIRRGRALMAGGYRRLLV